MYKLFEFSNPVLLSVNVLALHNLMSVLNYVQLVSYVFLCSVVSCPSCYRSSRALRPACSRTLRVSFSVSRLVFTYTCCLQLSAS